MREDMCNRHEKTEPCNLKLSYVNKQGVAAYYCIVHQLWVNQFPVAITTTFEYANGTMRTKKTRVRK